MHSELQQAPSLQNPLAHSEAPVQDWPFFLRQDPLALQALSPPQSGGSSWPTGTCVQLPVAHEKHTAGHSRLQHLPPEQKPERHSLPVLQLWPSRLRHCPLALQLLVSRHSGSSSVLTIREQVPVTQLWQGAVHSELQHFPSLQKPLAHSVLPVQGWPLRYLHFPSELQVFKPMHSGGSSARGTCVQVPVMQLMHISVQAVLQQTPSLQKPEAHSLPVLQDCPALGLHSPFPSQVLAP